MEKSPERVWQILFAVTFVLLLVMCGDKIRKTGTCLLSSRPAQTEVAPEAEMPAAVMEAPKPLHHYELRNAVPTEGYTEYVPSSQYQMQADANGVTFLSPSGKQLLHCNVMERLNARWPDPEDPALLRYRTVYEDYGYRAVFEYIEEWNGPDGSTTFKPGPVVLFRIP
jgi:hypothetical protein